MTEPYFNAKKVILAMPRPYEGYHAHISLDPESWGYGVSKEAAAKAAEHLAKKAESHFLGLKAVISPSPDNYPFDGEDPDTLEQISDWIQEHVALSLELFEEIRFI